jgi:hypothetical protein
MSWVALKMGLFVATGLILFFSFGMIELIRLWRKREKD